MALLLVVLILAVTRMWRPALFLAVALVGEVVMFLAVVAIVDRTRPDVSRLDGQLPTSSYPSGHLAATLCLYAPAAILVLTWTHRWWRWLVLAVARPGTAGRRLGPALPRHAPPDRPTGQRVAGGLLGHRGLPAPAAGRTAHAASSLVDSLRAARIGNRRVMTVADEARRQAHTVAHSNFLEWLTRIGFLGYGVLHLAVAWVALQLTLGKPSSDQGQSGAFRTVAAQPFGRFILIVVVVGLLAMAVWQLLLAFVGHRNEQGWHRPFERAASFGRTVIYTALALTAWQVVQGTGKSSARQQQDFTANLLAKPAGPALVVIVGLAVTALGVGMAVYGYKKLFVKRLKTQEMTANVRKATINLGRFGYLAKGFAFAVVGVLVVAAGFTSDPGKSRGLDIALKTLAQQPYGIVLLILVAAGFAAFGIYCFSQSRYRRI